MEEIKMEKVRPLKEGEFWAVFVPPEQMRPDILIKLKERLEPVIKLTGRKMVVFPNTFKLEAMNFERQIKYGKIIENIKAAVEELQDKNPFGRIEGENLPLLRIENIKRIAATFTHILDQCKKAGFE